jgi:hypothetical protein
MANSFSVASACPTNVDGSLRQIFGLLTMTAGSGTAVQLPLAQVFGGQCTLQAGSSPGSHTFQFSSNVVDCYNITSGDVFNLVAWGK